jgi:hypothetical protein
MVIELSPEVLGQVDELEKWYNWTTIDCGSSLRGIAAFFKSEA